MKRFSIASNVTSLSYQLHAWSLTVLNTELNPLKPSGHYMYRIVVTIRTTRLSLTNSTFCPHSVFMCFVLISEQTAIISLYNFNWQVCIIQTECVYCAVRIEVFHVIIITHLKPSGHYMYHQVITHKFYVLPTQLYLCVLCGSQNKQRLFPYTALTDGFV